MLWGMWEKVKLWGSLKNREGAPEIHGGVISWGLLERCNFEPPAESPPQ